VAGSAAKRAPATKRAAPNRAARRAPLQRRSGSRRPPSGSPAAPHVDAANAYVRRVVAGEETAGKNEILAARRHLAELERPPDADFPYQFNAEAAERVCRFAELLRHVKGPKAGQRFELEPWQSFVLCSIFGWLHWKSLLRRFRRFYLEIARGNGKSFLLAVIALFMLVADGEAGAEIYSAAKTRDQAKAVFEAARMIAKANTAADFRAYYGLDVREHSILQPSSGSAFRALASDADSLDGLNVHFAAVDELHAHPTRKVYDVLETAISKRDQPLLGVITTAGSDRTGICYELRTDLVNVLQGTATDHTLFGIVFTIDTEGRIEKLDFDDAVFRLERECTCGLAQITPIDQYAAEAIARAATTSTSAPATKATESGSERTGRSGPNETRSDEPESFSGFARSAPATTPRSSGSTGSESTASTRRPSDTSRRSREADAQSVARNRRLSTWITTTLRESCGGSSVSAAIRESAFSGTLSRAWSAHSNTCATRAWRIEGATLWKELPADDWRDERIWRKANPNLGVSVNLDTLRSLAKKAERTPAAQAAFKTKHLDVWVGANAALHNLEDWNACADTTLDESQFEGEECIAAIDLATKDDLAPRVDVFRREIDGRAHYYAFARTYISQGAVDDGRNASYHGWAIENRLIVNDGDTTDLQRIEDDVIDDATRFQFLEVAYDPWQATGLAQRLQARGATMVEIAMVARNLSEAVKTVDALMKERRIHHDGDPVFASCIANVVGHYDAKENVYPRKERPESKIDLAVALYMAMSRWLVRGDDEVATESPIFFA